MDDFEIVTMEDGPSPEPAPPEVSAPNGRPYEEVVNDDTKAEVFSQNGVCYYIKVLSLIRILHKRCLSMVDA